jgi:glucose 1-dehydrogenase
MRLEGKGAIVTGGSRGIGKAIAMAFAREGARVAIDYVGSAQGAAESVVKAIEALGGRAVALQADISQERQVRALVESTRDAFGRLDILVNNAGIEAKHPFLEMPFEVWQKVVAVNLTGVWLCSQIAAREMAAAGKGGRIVNISSIHEDVAMPTNAPYCAAKGGVRMLMRTIAVELAPHGITVNDVCPGAVDTPMDEQVKRDPTELRRLLEEIPLKRMAKPEEVAELCVFLASDAGAYVTGSSYTIDGGMMRRSGRL